MKRFITVSIRHGTKISPIFQSIGNNRLINVCYNVLYLYNRITFRGVTDMELWDAYNAQCEKIDGMTLVRGEESTIPDGVYHLVCNVLVKHTDGSYLLMQRDPRKTSPLKWEATAGGSALKGETPEECAERELFEETGIKASSLTDISRLVFDSTHCLYYHYLCVTGCEKDSIRLQDGETCAYRWASRDEVIAMSDDETVSIRMREYLRNNVSSD